MIDFCFKYRHPPRDKDSLPEFPQKLASKNQSNQRQEQAAKSISLYYDVVREWPPGKGPGAVAGTPEEAWNDIYRKLKEEIRLRQYSRKTHAAYRIWIEQFQTFLRDKPPETVTDDDARKYLTHLAVDRNVVATTQNQAFAGLRGYRRERCGDQCDRSEHLFSADGDTQTDGLTPGPVQDTLRRTQRSWPYFFMPSGTNSATSKFAGMLACIHCSGSIVS